MGINNYDPLVITALNEYARRYAGTLLLDAQDYAEHASRTVRVVTVVLLYYFDMLSIGKLENISRDVVRVLLS